MVVSGQVNGLSTQNDSWFEFGNLVRKCRRSAWGVLRYQLTRKSHRSFAHCLLNRTVPNVFQKRNRVEPHRTLQPVPRESHHHATKIHNKPTPQSHHLRYNIPVYLRLFMICFARVINHNIRYTKIMCKIRNLLTYRATEVSQE